MADIGFVPVCFGVRSRWFHTPWVGISLSTILALAVSYMNFAEIITSVNFLYSLGMLLEFASFLWLRKKLARVKRPFRVPMELPGVIMMCLIPSGFLIYVMTLATKTVYLVSSVLTLLGIVWYFFIKFCKSKQWLQFNETGFGYKLEFED